LPLRSIPATTSAAVESKPNGVVMAGMAVMAVSPRLVLGRIWRLPPVVSGEYRRHTPLARGLATPPDQPERTP
jgi:hypothetical protein